MKSLCFDEWEDKWFIPLRAAFHLQLYHLFWSELETLRHWPEPLASTQCPWSSPPHEQFGEQFSCGFIGGGGNYGRETCFLSDLWLEMAGAFFGKQDPQLWKPQRKVNSPSLTAMVARSGLCVPGILSWQRQSWGTADSLEPKRPQLSPLYLPVVTAGRWYMQGLFCQCPVTKMSPATFSFQWRQHLRVAFVSSGNLHQPRRGARAGLYCALNCDKWLAELPDHQTPKSPYTF